MFGDIRGRKGGNVRNSKTFFPKVLARKVRADERQEFRSKLSAADQLKELDLRLGVGKGAVKERARLMKQPTSILTPEGKVEPLKTGLTAEQKKAKKDATAKAKAMRFAPLK